MTPPVPDVPDDGAARRHPFPVDADSPEPRHLRRRDVAGILAGATIGVAGTALVDRVRSESTTKDTPNPFLDLRDFGAVGDGQANDTDATASWIAEAVRTGGTAYAPAGTYLLTAPVGADLTNHTLTVVGAGATSATTFLASDDNTDGVFAFTTGAPDAGQLVMRDLRVETATRGAGTAIHVEAPLQSGARYQRAVMLSNLVVSGLDGGQHSFRVGIHLQGAWRALLDSVYIAGPRDATVANNYSDDSPMFVGDVGLKLDNSYGWTVQNCGIWSYATCIEDSGSNGEGGHLSHTKLVGCKTALRYSRSSPEPGLMISDSHVNFRDTGFDIEGTQLAVIQNCLCYNENGPNRRQPERMPRGGQHARDIWLRNVRHVEVRGNTFHYPGNPDRTNIFVDATDGAHGVRIIENLFNSGSETNPTSAGVTVTARSELVSLIDNTFPGAYGEQVVDRSGTVTSSAIQAEDAVDDTALLLSVRATGGTSVRRVTVGPPNSAGIGYRVLRVGNDA